MTDEEYRKSLHENFAAQVKGFETPERIHMLSDAEINDIKNDLKLTIKELHNISQELKTLNTILRRMN